MTLTPPFAATEGIILALPAGTTAALRYCAELGGTEKKNDATAMKRKDAAGAARLSGAAAAAGGRRLDPNDLDRAHRRRAAGPQQQHARARSTRRTILIRELQEMGATGLNTCADRRRRLQAAVRAAAGRPASNILAVIPGSELPNEYVMVGAHYDHLATCRTVEVGDTVCNGATDNATGVAAALAIGRGIAALPTPPRRSVILAFWDAEEDGLRGSALLRQQSARAARQHGDLRQLRHPGRQSAAEHQELHASPSARRPARASTRWSIRRRRSITLDLRLLSYIFGQFRSDYINFIIAGVPTVFFSDSTGPCYHTNDDEVAVVDFSKLEQQTRLGYDLTIALADAATPPTFAGQNPALASFADAVIIDEVLTTGLADLVAVRARRSGELQQIQADVAAIVADGPGDFDSADCRDAAERHRNGDRPADAHRVRRVPVILFATKAAVPPTASAAERRRSGPRAFSCRPKRSERARLRPAQPYTTRTLDLPLTSPTPPGDPARSNRTTRS